MSTLKELKRNNLSYLMLKPDSRENINNILNELENNLYKIIRMYHIDPFKENAITVYENKKSNYDYYQAIKAHLFLSSYYFGNHGLLVIVDINDKSSLESFKRYIRARYTLGDDNSSQLLINLNKFTEFDRNVPDGQIHVKSGDEYKPLPFYKDLNGKWGVVTLNMLHAPDNYDEYLDDITNFYKNGVLNENNLIESNELVKIIKYKSYERMG